MEQNKVIEDKILDEILKSIQKINYGEVVITIHNSKIVQIERREKKRFDLKPTIKMEAKV
ncbi:MAG: YezD family protein [Candidatus Omnitrophica bacterium]|nr:YezD family protein [Candidatus Omnitrophota bacterium]MCM8798358.1 YezD family protein [Candidatus Omnitrophota bacterium]